MACVCMHLWLAFGSSQACLLVALELNVHVIHGLLISIACVFTPGLVSQLSSALLSLSPHYISPNIWLLKISIYQGVFFPFWPWSSLRNAFYWLEFWIFVLFFAFPEQFLESEDDCVKKRCKKSTDRRNHQRMWTAPEVLKLIDGIAQYGTGRWTDITKLMLSSTAYRTPIDLRVPLITFSN